MEIPRTKDSYISKIEGISGSSHPSAGQHAGRWMVIDDGDIDGDGDVDLILGSFVGLLEAHIPETLRRRWIDESPSVVILENTIR